MAHRFFSGWWSIAIDAASNPDRDLVHRQIEVAGCRFPLDLADLPALSTAFRLLDGKESQSVFELLELKVNRRQRRLAVPRGSEPVQLRREKTSDLLRIRFVSYALVVAEAL
jgi:hypothetical protein